MKNKGYGVEWYMAREKVLEDHLAMQRERADNLAADRDTWRKRALLRQEQLIEAEERIADLVTDRDAT